MFKKMVFLFFAALLLANMSGCIALLAGAAGGAGTAGWLSGKLTQEFNASFEKAIEATTSALDSLFLDITKKTVKEDVAQVMAEYHDERTIWIDIFPISDSMSSVSVRVGMIGDEEASRKILNKIEQFL